MFGGSSYRKAQPNHSWRNDGMEHAVLGEICFPANQWPALASRDETAALRLMEPK